MNYEELFPQCKGCPHLEQLQERHDTHVMKIEEAESLTLDWQLRAITEDTLTQVTGEDILELLDRIKTIEDNGDLTSEIIQTRDELLAHFARLDTETREYGDLVKERIKWHEEYVTTINGMLPDYDLAASLAVEHCDGYIQTNHALGSVACVSAAQFKM